MTFLQGFCIALTVSTALYLFREELTQLFTDDQDGIDVSVALEVIPLLCLVNLISMCLSFFLGTIRALGIQSSAAVVSIVSYLLVSNSAAYYLAFEQAEGVFGLWIGFYTGVIFQILLLAVMTLIMADWQKISD